MSVEPLGVLGAGWVGLVTAACFAELGHDVVVRDIVPARIAGLREGRLPIYEPGLAGLVGANRGRLRFTESAGDVFDEARIVFVCVGTPPTYSGDADLTAVHRVLDELPADGRALTLVMKSTVPVGTGEKVRAELAGRGVQGVTYVSNPEFLAESTAIHDFMHPDRVVVGSFGEGEGALVASLYGFADAPIVRTDVPTAEMIKYASNAFLATKISFINEIANVCDETGADVARVAEGMGYDRRIGPHFLRPGIGYSGNCLVGSETVVARQGARVRHLRLDSLYAELSGGAEVGYVEPIGLDVLSWTPELGSSFERVSLVCRRPVEGEVMEVRTATGRGVTCTTDHPFVTTRRPRDDAETAVKEARELDDGDWLPLALDAGSGVDWPGEDAEPFVPGAARPRTGGALAVQAERIAPAGYRRARTAAWARVTSVHRRPHRGWVYSLEVPGSETFVTTGGLVTHNCLPKDVAALKQLAGNSGYHFQLLTAVIEVNELQKRRVLGKLAKHLGPLRGKTVALLGLAFKPNTNDMREASSLVLAARLLAEGAIVRGWDPAALDEARAVLSGVELHDDLLAALEGADAAIVVTEWDEVRRFPFERARATMASAVLIDGRNVLDPAEARAHGFLYESIGRPSAGES